MNESAGLGALDILQSKLEKKIFCMQIDKKKECAARSPGMSPERH